MIDFNVPIFPGAPAPIQEPVSSLPPNPMMAPPDLSMMPPPVPVAPPIPQTPAFNVPVLPKKEEKKPQGEQGYSAGQITKAQELYKKEQATKDKLKAQATPIQGASLENAGWGKL